MKKLRLGIQILFGIAVAFGAAVVSFTLLKTAPQTVPADKKQAAKIVQVMMLEPDDERIVVSAWGTVIPAREVTIRPQVSGRVISQNEALVPGGHLTKGDEIVRIDPSDYEFALTEKRAELVEAEYENDVEKGRQLVARREFDQLRDELPVADMNPALALREPQLRRAEAMIAKAQNAIDRAKLDLDRTVLNAPFNSMVIEESVETGQLVDSGSDICRLVGSDTFWVRATLPMSDIGRIKLPDGATLGAPAEVYFDTGNGHIEPWAGTVVRLLTDLEASGRMARLLVEVEDPLRLQSNTPEQAPLLLGSYVKVEIEAGTLENVLEIPRAALREGNRLWMVGLDNRIRIAEPEILWTRPETVLVPDMRKDGERLIVSELKSALPGMEVNPQPLSAEE